jgi:dihydropteroate synthase
MANKFLALPIINITPDSFFDGGETNTAASFKKRLHHLITDGARAVDIGAQSTAPGSCKISAATEILRWRRVFLPNIGNLGPLEVLSIDTYRFTTFFYLYKKLSSKYPQMTLIWNDVSGVIDRSIISFLKKCPSAKYVACHTFNRRRQDACQHLKNLRSHVNLIPQMTDYFDKIREIFTKFGRSADLILDPAFGFSKNDFQNIFLANQLEKLTNRYAGHWYLGISNKRFLKRISGSNGTLSTEKTFTSNWKKKLIGTFYLRSHVL